MTGREYVQYEWYVCRIKTIDAGNVIFVIAVQHLVHVDNVDCVLHTSDDISKRKRFEKKQLIK